MLEFNEKLIAFDLQAEDAKEVIALLAGKMHVQGLVSAEYGAQTWAREMIHPTGLPTKPLLALPSPTRMPRVSTAPRWGWL